MLPGIDPHERARPDQRIHRKVVQADVTKCYWCGTASLRDSEWSSGRQYCFRHETRRPMTRGTERRREGPWDLGILVFCRYEQGQVWISNGLVFFNLINISAIKPDEIEELSAIDHA